MSDAPFYSEEEEEEESESEEDSNEEEEEKEKKKKKPPKKKPYVMDPDHRLLLRNCKPLLQSRNAAVSDVTSVMDNIPNDSSKGSLFKS